MWSNKVSSNKQTEPLKLGGGLDTDSPEGQGEQGSCFSAANFELGSGGRGYRRIDGYERYDGRALASSYTFELLYGALTAAVGNTVTGQTSGATAKVLAVEATYLVVARRVGVFVSAETLLVSGSPIGSLTAVPVDFQLPPMTELSYIALAADEYRTSILAVPGSGAVRGIFDLGGKLYAIRDNSGGTAGVLHRADSTGWTAVGLGVSLPFNTGNAGPITVGQTVTGATSGATGVVTKVIREGGSVDWSAGDPTYGQLIFASITGTFQLNENLQVAATTKAKASAASSANALPAGGKYTSIQHAFIGGSSSVYAANGVGLAFEYDGTSFAFIRSGLSTPKYVSLHGNKLLLTQGSNFSISGPEGPHIWTAILGAATLAVGSDITGVAKAGGDAASPVSMVTSGSTGIYMFYGTDTDSFRLTPISNTVSAKDRSVVAGTVGMFLSSTAAHALFPTQDFGNFSSQIISTAFRRFLEAKVSEGISCAVYDELRQAIRILFADKSSMVFFFDGPSKFTGAMPMAYEHQFNVAHRATEALGSRIYLGGDDGFVYLLNSGTSFDGLDITSWVRLRFHFSRSVGSKKRYFDGLALFSGVDSAFSFYFSYELSLSSPDVQPGVTSLFETPGAGGRWDESLYDVIYYDLPSIIQKSLPISGRGNSLSVGISALSNKERAWTLDSLLLTYKTGKQYKSYA